MPMLQNWPRTTLALRPDESKTNGRRALLRFRFKAFEADSVVIRRAASGSPCDVLDVRWAFRRSLLVAQDCSVILPGETSIDRFDDVHEPWSIDGNKESSGSEIDQLIVSVASHQP